MFIILKPLTTVVFLQIVGLKIVIIDYINLLYSNIFRVVKSMPYLLKLNCFEIQAKIQGYLSFYLAISRKTG